MKILVCVKQVPDMESKFTINPDTSWYDETDLAFRMNEYDEYAMEQAVLLKESVGGDTQITVLSIGPDRVKEAIKKALAMGADKGAHIKDDKYYDKDAFAIATTIASFAKENQFDIIFTGMQSEDRGSAQVGVALGEMLEVPSISAVVDFSYADGVVIAKRELEGGVKATFKASLPLVITCQLGLNTPRYPTLPNIMKAKKKELTTIEVAELGSVKPLATAQSMYPPVKKSGGVVLEGEPATLADKLIEILREKTSAL